MNKSINQVTKVVFVRNGECAWKAQNKLTGWTDTHLSTKGIQDSKNVGKTLAELKYTFDICYTSLLPRAIQTFNHLSSELGPNPIPVIENYQLNDRHFGALQGKNKKEISNEHGEDQVKLWKKGYNIPLPPVDTADERYPGNQDKYRHLPKEVLPTSESLKNAFERVMPFWFDVISKGIQNKQVLVVADSDSIKAIVKHLYQMSEEEIMNYYIPSESPLVFELDESKNVLRHYFIMNTNQLPKSLCGC